MVKSLPEVVETERLILRMPQVAYVAEFHAGILESLDELLPWMPFAMNGGQPIEQTEEFVRMAAANFILGKDFHYMVFPKETGLCSGIATILRINWNIPCVEIGYWLRTSATGKGYMTEAVNALTDLAFTVLKAERIEIRMNAGNTRSSAVAERSGYTFESRMKHNSRDTNGVLGDLLVYVKLAESN